MANLNKVFLMGNLTRDPELRYTPQGTAVASFGLAVNRKWKGPNGEDKEDVVFVDVTAFARQAEVLSEYMSKGRGIFIEGRLKLDQWQDKESGAKRSKLTVVAENFQFLGGPGQQGQQGQQGASDSKPPRRTAKPGAGPSDQGAADAETPPPDDDIPF
jgi:single-strand DNA-binding protein